MFKQLFPIYTPVIFNGKFATVTGYDEGAEQIIIEFCDHRNGKFITVNPFDLTIDKDGLDYTSVSENFRDPSF